MNEIYIIKDLGFAQNLSAMPFIFILNLVLLTEL